MLDSSKMKRGFLIPLACVAAMFMGSFAYAVEPSNSDLPASEAQPCLNNVDTPFGFYLGYAGATSGTEGRWKDTASSIYIKINGFQERAPRMYVDGSWSTGGYWTDCTDGIYYGAKYGEYEMYNLVKERGYVAARLTSWAESAPGSVWGVWSPDCVGHFPRL